MRLPPVLAVLGLLTVPAAGCGADDAGPAGAEGERPTATAAPRAKPTATAPPATAPASAAQRPAVEIAGSVVLLRFNGPAAPEYVLRALRERRAAGVVLFADNVVSREQTERMLGALHDAGDGRTLVAVDQEGGAIRNVPWAGPPSSQPAQAAAGTVRADARAAARVLRDTGIDVVLGPVADVPEGPASIMAGRAFGRDPQAVAEAVRGAVRGWLAGGVAPTAKHFPGLGPATVNTDDAPATIHAEPELRPFAAAVDAGVPLVMVGHARHTAVDADRIASQSRPVVQGLLRERLGFDGVVVTDSLEAEAAVATGSVEQAAERGVRAGVDLLLTTGQGSYLRIVRHLKRVARRDPTVRRMLEASIDRVDALRERVRRGPAASP